MSGKVNWTTVLNGARDSVRDGKLDRQNKPENPVAPVVENPIVSEGLPDLNEMQSIEVPKPEPINQPEKLLDQQGNEELQHDYAPIFERLRKLNRPQEELGENAEENEESESNAELTVDSGTEDMSVEERLKHMNKDYTQKSQANAAMAKKLQGLIDQVSAERERLEQAMSQMTRPPGDAVRSGDSVTNGDNGSRIENQEVTAEMMLQELGVETDDFMSPDMLKFAKGLAAERNQNRQLAQRLDQVMNLIQGDRVEQRRTQLQQDWKHVQEEMHLPPESEFAVLSILKTMKNYNPKASIRDAAQHFLTGAGQGKMDVQALRSRPDFPQLVDGVIGYLEEMQKSHPNIPSANRGPSATVPPAKKKPKSLNEAFRMARADLARRSRREA